MSETVNNATIRVDVDASGVDAGLRRIEEGANRTGKNLDNLGATAKRTATSLEEVARTPGLEAAGDGAGVAAGRMDRATKSMADSIQRTLATMNAGAKGSAQYYEALANSRGLDVNALRPFLNQLDEMTKKSAAAAEAQRKLDESTKFLDSLRARTEGIGKSASELAALRAQQLGVSDAAAEMIEQLRQQEEAGESSFGSLSESAEGYKTTLLAVGAAVAAAAVAGAALVNVAINDLAELDDMAQKTGSSVESLSKIQKLATVFGADMAVVDGALTKLSKGMADLDEDSSKVQKALKALGVSSRDAAGGLRDPSVVLVDAATKLSGYNDSAAKTALINDLIGKSGADLLPFLNDLADNYDKVTGTSGEAAGAAAEFQDHIGWLTMDLKGLVTSVAVDVAPTLRDLVGTFSDVYKQQAKLEKGDWSEWADDLGLGFAKASDAVATFARSTKVAWDALKAVRAGFEIVNGLALISPVEAAYESFTGGDGLKDVKKSYADLRQAILDGQGSIESLSKAPSDAFEAAYRARLAGRAAPADAAPGAPVPRRRELDYGSGSDKGVEKAAKAAQEYEALLDRINGKTVGIDPSFYADLGKLYAGYKAGKQSLSEYVATVETYIGQQPFAKQAEQDRLRAAKELSDFQEGYAKSQAAYTAVLDKRLQDAETEATRNEELARTYGMSKSAVEALELARLEEQLAQRSTLGLTLTEIETLEKLIDAKKRNAAAVSAMEQVDAAKKAAEEWKRAADSIEQSLTDALLRGFESGKDFGQNLVDTLKNMFGTLVLRPIISAAVTPLAAGLTNTLGLGGAAGAAGAGATGLAGVASGVSNLYGLATGGATLAGGLGTGFLGSLAGGLNGAGIGSGLTSALGMNIGNGIASVVGPNIASGIASGLSGLAAAAPWVAGALAVVSIGKAAFGRGPKEYSGEQTLNGSLGAGGFSGTMDAEWVKKGGWFRSDKKGTDRNPVGAEFAAGLTSAYDAIKASSADFAEVLGLNAASIASRSQTIKIALGKDEAANQAAIAEFFAGVANTVAAELLPEIGKFQVQGEQASATLQRLAVNFSAVDQILVAMGTSSEVAFRAVGAASIEARERLLAFAGGVDALASATTFFNDNFLSEAERVAIIQKPLQEGLAALGFASLTTADQYKEAVQQLVSSGALATEQGAKQYAGLLALGAQFKTVSDYLKSVGDAAAETARLAAEAAQKATEAARQAALDQALSLTSGVDDAFSVLQRVVGRQKEALQEDIQARTEAVNKLRSLTDAARNSLNGMRTPEQQQASQAQARSEIGAALAIARAGGGLGDVEKLQRAIANLGSGPSTDAYASYQDYQRDLFQTQGDLAELGKLTDSALSVEERALNAAQDQVKQLDLMLAREQEQIDVLKGISTTGLSIVDALRALQGALAAANANPVVAASSAINGAYQQYLGRAPDAEGFEWWKNAAAGGAPISQIVNGIAGSTEAELNRLYKDVLGRAPDAEGLAFWKSAYGSTMSEAEKADWLKAAQKDALGKLPGFAVGTNFVKADMPAMIHQGERIMPAADNRELMRRLANPESNSEALAAEVARLSAVLEAQQRENVELREALRDGLLAIATHTSNTASHLDDVVNGRKPIATEPAQPVSA
jgi:hypothetical protein